MNWALLLAEYPRILLRDEFPIVILAMLERTGLTTETELVQHVRIEPHKLSGILIDLHRNQFVEFGRNSIRVSDRGKILLERFDTHSGVIEDFLDSLHLQDAERTAYRLIVRTYRDKAFPQYLNSLCSIKTWEAIADKAEPERRDQYEGSSHIGKQTLLIRDLRNWFVHARPSVTLFENLNDDVRKAITTEEKIIQIENLNPANRAVVWLHALDQSHAELRSNLLRIESAPLVRSLWLLDDFQKFWEKNEWFDSWCDIPTEWLSTAETGENFLYSLAQSLSRTRSAELQTKLRSGLLGSSYWWIDEAADGFNSDFLGKLMLASTLEELSTISGMNKESLQTTLTDIQERCRTLLSTVDEGLDSKKES
jgi:hypothetical protein